MGVGGLVMLGITSRKIMLFGTPFFTLPQAVAPTCTLLRTHAPLPASAGAYRPRPLPQGFLFPYVASLEFCVKVE